MLYCVFCSPEALQYTVLYYCTSVMVCQATCPSYFLDFAPLAQQVFRWFMRQISRCSCSGVLGIYLR